MGNTDKQTITATASPRPWRVNGHSIEANDPEGLWLQNEKTGWGVVANLPSCPKSRMSKKNRETWDAIVEANATLIVRAVNAYADPRIVTDNSRVNADLLAERDRLRDELDVERSQHHTDIEQAEYHEEHHRKILEAERDRLRDIVRRLANMAETTIPDAMENWNGFTAGRVEFEREAYALIREARAAIGKEGTPCAKS